jgi:hypothetical protein
MTLYEFAAILFFAVDILAIVVFVSLAWIDRYTSYGTVKRKEYREGNLFYCSVTKKYYLVIDDELKEVTTISEKTLQSLKHQVTPYRPSLSR